MSQLISKPRRLRYAPLDTVTAPEAAGQPKPGRAECPRCGKTFSGGQIVDLPSGEWSTEHECFPVFRQLYCDHCDHVVNWLEAGTLEGRPTGTVLSGPGVVRSRNYVERFLRQHPEARGVVPA